ncbi:hypothetical protein [Pseudomonas hunanensis]|jgi:hypothetical protein|uniref:hypothetical protein n=1 Tax=Pseudomonas hunanensis TaxID=1247546 RepID=UPI002405B353|nr:hypothetical protein [Pseudomonas hunanensis]MDF9755158.1 hypothetical protein [Pseudomonas hunanensis]
MVRKRLKERDAQGNQVRARHMAGESDESDLRPPVFSLEYLQSSWCIQDCQQAERARMLERLRQISQRTWREIRQLDRHGYGTETISRGSIRAVLPSFLTEDVRLLAFRAFDLVAMVGYRSGRIFHVIWIDREFKLYKH